MSIDPAVNLVIRLLLASLWGLAVWEKWSRWPRFASIVEAYELLPQRWVSVAARFVVGWEVALAAGLLFPQTARWAAAGSAGLLLAYALLIGRELRAHRVAHDCGCLGRAGQGGLHPGLIWRNVALALLAFVAVLPVSQRPWSWVDAWTVLFAFPAAFFLYAALDALLAIRGVAPRRAPVSSMERGSHG